ncbi:MAG: hypothetical protein JO308_03715 [Verrucomicrobia bacterium]|nr:hypothetical protein [Verrucomicrobiota bacterium]
MSLPRHRRAIVSSTRAAQVLAFALGSWYFGAALPGFATPVPLLPEEALYPIRIQADEPLHLQSPINFLSAGTLALILKQSNSSQQIQISGAEIVGPLDLQRAEVPAEVVLEGCVFQGPVTLDNSWFHHALVCKNCTFRDVVSGNFAKIDADLNLSGSSFLAGVNLSGAQIADDLVLRGAHFQGSVPLDLSAKVVVGSNLDAREATFGAGANWNHLQVKGLLRLSQARFTDAGLESIQIGEDVVAAHTVIEGSLLMSYAEARGIYFTNCTIGRDVSIPAATIHRHLSFQNSTVLGRLIANQSQIAYDLDLREASINGAQPNPSPDNASPGPSADNTPANQSPTQVSQQRPTQPKLPTLEITRLKANGITRLNGAKIQGIISMPEAELQILSVDDLQHSPSNGHTVLLTRTIVHEFEVPDRVEKTAKVVRAFLDQAVYDPGIYNQFDSFLRTQGDYDDADNVFVRSQVRNRDENLNHDWVASLRSWLWFAFTGYGRLVWLSIVWSAGVVIIGTIVFWNRSNMALREEKLQNLDYNPFWFSLDVFAPIIDLEAARIWEPRPEKHWLWNYLRIQRILGWILVPLALVAITGALQFTG